MIVLDREKIDTKVSEGRLRIHRPTMSWSIAVLLGMLAGGTERARRGQ